jgi:hypothetical protein
MKNKWLVVLFIFFLGVIFLSLLIAQQSQKGVSLCENKIPVIAQVENRITPAYSTQVRLAPVARLPLVKSGKAIIKASSTIEPAGENILAPKIAGKATNNVASPNLTSSSKAEDSPQAGITRIGKRPTSKEAQEMNSSGIVAY